MESLAVALDRLRLAERALPKWALRLLGGLIPGRGALLSALADAGWSGVLRAQGVHMTRHWSEAEKRALWGGEHVFEASDALVRKWYELVDSPEPLDQLQQVYCHSWLVEDLLMKADKMTMAASLELRVPFLDHALVEWAGRLPLAWRVGDRARGRSSKRVLRAFAARRLPPRILNRPKQGFPVPAYRWLAGPLGAWAETLLCERDSCLGAYLDLSRARPAIRAARRGNLAAAHKVWVLIVAEYWMRRWL